MLKTKRNKGKQKKLQKSKKNNHKSKTLTQLDVFVETAYQYLLNISSSNCFKKVNLDIIRPVELLLQILAPIKAHPDCPHCVFVRVCNNSRWQKIW